MKNFQVLLKGENFLLNLDGELRCFGFHTTRWVKAQDEQEAQKIAVILVRQNPHLQTIQTNESSSPSRIVIEKVREISSLRYFLKKSKETFTFFSEEEAEDSLPVQDD